MEVCLGSASCVHGRVRLVRSFVLIFNPATAHYFIFGLLQGRFIFCRSLFVNYNIGLVWEYMMMEMSGRAWKTRETRETPPKENKSGYCAVPLPYPTPLSFAIPHPSCRLLALILVLSTVRYVKCPACPLLPLLHALCVISRLVLQDTEVSISSQMKSRIVQHREHSPATSLIASLITDFQVACVLRYQTARTW